ncbi:MAG: hypothetical protein WC548_00505 [Candidatus Pacearchaeota archaeon]
MRNKKVYLLLIVVILVMIIFVCSDFTDKRVVPVRVFISNATGFDFEYNGLSFGQLQINQSASRDMRIENTQGVKIKVMVKSSGEISKNIIVSENNFYLNPGEVKNLTFSFYADGLSEYREYKGEVEIVTKKWWI